MKTVIRFINEKFWTILLVLIMIIFSAMLYLAIRNNYSRNDITAISAVAVSIITLLVMIILSHREVNSNKTNLDGLVMSISDRDRSISDFEKSVIDYERKIEEYEKTIRKLERSNKSATRLKNRLQNSLKSAGDEISELRKVADEHKGTIDRFIKSIRVVNGRYIVDPEKTNLLSMEDRHYPLTAIQEESIKELKIQYDMNYVHGRKVTDHCFDATAFTAEIINRFPDVHDRNYYLTRKDPVIQAQWEKAIEQMFDTRGKEISTLRTHRIITPANKLTMHTGMPLVRYILYKQKY